MSAAGSRSLNNDNDNFDMTKMAFFEVFVHLLAIPLPLKTGLLNPIGVVVLGVDIIFTKNWFGSIV